MNTNRLKTQDEAFSALEATGFNGGIIMPTGSGKSYVIIKALTALPEKYNILYCCDNLMLRDKDFPAELKKWGKEEFLLRMERMCYKSAYKLNNESYNVLVLDEGDYCLTPKYIDLLKNNHFDHIIFVSATLSKEKKKIIEQYIPIVYEKTVSEAEDEQVINKAQLYIVAFDLWKGENARYLWYNQEFVKEFNGSNNPEKIDTLTRNRKLFLSDLESSAAACKKLCTDLLKDKNNKILIFCNSTKQANKVAEYAYHQYSNHPEYLDMLSQGTIRKAAVVGKVDRGVNLEGINIVVFDCPAQSQSKSTQKSGRARRLEIGEVSRFYYLVPFFKDKFGSRRATVVQKWVLNSTANFNQNFKYIEI